MNTIFPIHTLIPYLQYNNHMTCTFFYLYNYSDIQVKQDTIYDLPHSRHDFIMTPLYVVLSLASCLFICIVCLYTMYPFIVTLDTLF